MASWRTLAYIVLVLRSVRTLLLVSFSICVAALACGAEDGANTTTTSDLGGGGSLAISKPAPERVVAVGDLHGDLDATRRALRLAGAIDNNDKWIGGNLVVVQTGDQVDRGDDDREVLDLVERLKTDAPKTGGQFIALVGNHEIMNDELDFRYTTKNGFFDFSNVGPQNKYVAQLLGQLKGSQRGRAAAFFPTGPYAQMLSRRPVIARVGDSIFVHGGVVPKWIQQNGGLDAINSDTAAWLRGEKNNPPKAVTADDGPLWSRLYSDDEHADPNACAALNQTLQLLNAKRMVVGHTVQQHINAACNDKAWRIDVGMTAYYGGPIEVLELRGDNIRVLREGH